MTTQLSFLSTAWFDRALEIAHDAGALTDDPLPGTAVSVELKGAPDASVDAFHFYADRAKLVTVYKPGRHPAPQCEFAIAHRDVLRMFQNPLDEALPDVEMRRGHPLTLEFYHQLGPGTDSYEMRQRLLEVTEGCERETAWYAEAAGVEPVEELSEEAREALARLPRGTEPLRQAMKNRKTPGVQLYVSLRGEVVANCGIGWAASDVPMASDSDCAWLCCGKSMGAAALMHLWERGLVDIEAAVAHYIPEFATGGKDRFTIRHLLSHTTSVPVASDPVATRIFGPREQALKAICDFEVDREIRPGSVANYSTAWAWLVLCEVVRRTTGSDLNEYIQTEILDPLGLKDIWLGLDPDRLQDVQGRAVQMYNCLGPRPARSLVLNTPVGTRNAVNTMRAPASQIGRFLEYLMDGRTDGRSPISAQSRLAMTSRQRTGLADYGGAWRIDHGLGVQIESHVYDGERSVLFSRHASLRSFGHYGFPGAVVMADPEAGLVVAAYLNGFAGVLEDIVARRSLVTGIYEVLGLAVAA